MTRARAGERFVRLGRAIVLTAALFAATANAGPRGLENVYWKLTQLGGEPVAGGSGAHEAHLLFDPVTLRVTGAGGCNRLMGGFELQGDALRFGRMAGTMMSCAEGMDVEQAFQRALQRVERWRLVDGELELLDGDGRLLARFEARARP